MESYDTKLFDTVSVQYSRAKSDRVGKFAVYLYMFPNIAVNKYGNWMDTNVVLPLSTDRCVVIFDWCDRLSLRRPLTFRYHRDAATRKEQLLKELDNSVAIQDEDVYISESVQSGLLSKTYDVGRYAPSVEIAAHHFHLQISHAASRYLFEEAAKLNS